MQRADSLQEQMFESAMRRALDLAKLGPSGDVNPQVGCVIIDEQGRSVAEGWHQGVGTSHAETDALAHLSSGWIGPAKDLTAVVTLEPCSHTGHTGPCAVALVDAGIGRVVFALADPGKESGGGAEILREAGIEVVEGVLAGEARVLLSDWLVRQVGATGQVRAGQRRSTLQTPTKKPHVIAKWAQTLDARAAAADGTSQWITGTEARVHVHTQRALADAILVGTGTVKTDNPSLTARDQAGGLLVPAELQPIPVIFGDSDVVSDALINGHPALESNGLAEPLRVRAAQITEDLEALGARGISSIYIEGGPQTISTWLRAGLVDELHIYVAPTLLGGSNLATADLEIETLSDALHLSDMSVTKLGNDLLITARPAKSQPQNNAASQNESER